MELKERIKKIISHHLHCIDERVLFCRLCDIDPSLFNLNVSSNKFADEIVEYAETCNEIISLKIILGTMKLRSPDAEIHENERVIQAFEPNIIDYKKIHPYEFSSTRNVIAENFSTRQLRLLVRLFGLNYGQFPASGAISSYSTEFVDQIIKKNRVNQLKFYCKKLGIDLQLPQ